MNLYLDCSLAWVSSDMEGAYGVFQLKPMGNKWLNVNKSTGNKPDGLGVLKTSQIGGENRKYMRQNYLVSITILELQINLIGAKVHKGELCPCFRMNSGVSK